MTSTIEEALLANRKNGKKSLVVYLTGGLDEHFESTVEEVSAAGADVIEIGIPFSDPVMDGPTIQQANDKALAAGATPISILDRVKRIESPTPMAVMTYYNIAASMGLERFASSLAQSGVSGCILPDLPLEEVEPWIKAADEEKIETILLAAPTAPDERLPIICEKSKGFIYGVGLLGVTGVRQELSASAIEIATRLKKVTDLPVLVGVGVGTPDQAVEASKASDGVVVGSAVVERMLNEGDPEKVGSLVREFRVALDESVL